MAKTKFKITKEERLDHKLWLRDQKKLDKTSVKNRPTKGVIA